MASWKFTFLPILWLISTCIVAFAVESEYDEDNPDHQNKIMAAVSQDIEEAKLAAQSLHTVRRDRKICFKPVGCFTDTFVASRPTNPKRLGVFFSFNTLKKQANLTWDASDKEIRSELADMFINETRLVLVTHGFGASSDGSWPRELTDALLHAYPAKNIVVMLIDWRKGAALPLYHKAAANVQVVARLAMQFVLKLQKIFPNTIPTKDIHFIGHSLGGQMSGYFARDFIRETKTKIGRITAFDTAGPLFEENGIYPKKGEANFVEGVHTSAGGRLLKGQLGVERAYGDIDYYPNGGQFQPGCVPVNAACSHGRSYLYYIAALRDENCRMIGPRCETVDDALEGNCVLKAPKQSFLGQLRKILLPFDGSNHTIIYFKTTKEEPYCIRNE